MGRGSCGRGATSSRRSRSSWPPRFRRSLRRAARVRPRRGDPRLPYSRRGPHGMTTALIASPWRCSSSAAAVSSSASRWDDQRPGIDYAAGDQIERGAHVGGAGRVARGHGQLAQEQRRAVDPRRRVGRRRRVHAHRSSRRHRLGGSGDRIGLGRAHDGDVDELVAVTLGSGCERPGEAVSARLADPHGVDAAGVGGGDRQQAVDAGADHEQLVARAQARALLRAQHARQRLDQRCVDGVQAVGERRAARPPARARGGRARRSRRDPGASRGTARTSSRGRGGSGGTRRMACDGGSRPDRRRRRCRPHRRPTARPRSAHGRAPPAAWPPRTSPSRRRRRHRTRGPRRRPRRVRAQGHRVPRCGRRRHRTSGRLSSGHQGGERLGVDGLGDAALGHERCDQCRRRHVERGVAAGRVRPASVRCWPALRTSSGSRSSIAICAPDGHLRVDRRGRPRDDERDPRGPSGQRQAVGADFVRDVAVGGDPVTADDHGVELAAGDQPSGGGVDRQLVRDPQLRSSYTVSRAPWSSGRVSVAIAPRRPPRRHSSAITASAVPRPGAASAPVLQCVSTRRLPASSSAPLAAIASLDASSSAWIALASPSAASAR